MRTFLEELKTNERPQLACPDKAGKEWPFARHLHLHELINVLPDSSDQILSDHDLYVESSFSMRREIQAIFTKEKTISDSSYSALDLRAKYHTVPRAAEST